jgi:transcriptional regulator with XRE-family HTH domain
MSAEAVSELQLTLAKNVGAARNVQGLTQDDLARSAELSRATIVKIEAGEGDPSVSTIARVAEALGTSPLLLLMGKDEILALSAVIDDRGGLKRLSEGVSEEQVAEWKRLVDSGLPKGQRQATASAGAAATTLGLSAVGAAIGTMLMPGVGTAIGAAIATLVAANVRARRSDRPPPSVRRKREPVE